MEIISILLSYAHPSVGLYRNRPELPMSFTIFIEVSIYQNHYLSLIMVCH